MDFRRLPNQRITKLQKQLAPVLVRRMQKIPVILLFEEHTKDITKYTLPLLHNLITGFRPHEVLMVTESTGLEHDLFTRLKRQYPTMTKSPSMTEFTREFTLTCPWVIAIFLEVLPYFESYATSYLQLKKRMSVMDNFDIISLVHKKLKQPIEAYMTKILQSVATVGPQGIPKFHKFMEYVSEAPHKLYENTFEQYMKSLISAFCQLLTQTYPPCQDSKFIKLLQSMASMNPQERSRFVTKFKTNLRAIRDRAFIHRLSQYIQDHPEIKIVVSVFGTSHFPNLYRYIEKSPVLSPHPLTRLISRELKKQDITKLIQDTVYERIIAKKLK